MSTAPTEKPEGTMLIRNMNQYYSDQSDVLRELRQSRMTKMSDESLDSDFSGYEASREYQGKEGNYKITLKQRRREAFSNASQYDLIIEAVPGPTWENGKHFTEALTTVRDFLPPQKPHIILEVPNETKLLSFDKCLQTNEQKKLFDDNIQDIEINGANRNEYYADTYKNDLFYEDQKNIDKEYSEIKERIKNASILIDNEIERILDENKLERAQYAQFSAKELSKKYPTLKKEMDILLNLKDFLYEAYTDSLGAPKTFEDVAIIRKKIGEKLSASKKEAETLDASTWFKRFDNILLRIAEFFRIVEKSSFHKHKTDSYDKMTIIETELKAKEVVLPKKPLTMLRDTQQKKEADAKQNAFEPKQKADQSAENTEEVNPPRRPKSPR